MISDLIFYAITYYKCAIAPKKTKGHKKPRQAEPTGERKYEK